MEDISNHLKKLKLKTRFFSPIFPKNFNIRNVLSEKRGIRMAIVGDYPNILDMEEKKIFSKKSNQNLFDLLEKSNINLDEIFFTKVFLTYSVYNNLNFFLIDENENEEYIKKWASKLPKYKNFYINRKWEHFIIKTKCEIEILQPKVILGLGEFVYWVFFDNVKDYKQNIGKELVIGKRRKSKERIWFIPSYEKELIENNEDARKNFVKHLETFKKIAYGGLDYF